MVAFRCVGLGFAATVKLMLVVPVPLPGTPETHEGTPLLVQAQPDVVFTSKVLEAPPATAL